MSAIGTKRTSACALHMSAFDTGLPGMRQNEGREPGYRGQLLFYPEHQRHRRPIWAVHDPGKGVR
jgi:hypothetical protein